MFNLSKSKLMGKNKLIYSIFLFAIFNCRAEIKNSENKDSQDIQTNLNQQVNKEPDVSKESGESTLFIKKSGEAKDINKTWVIDKIVALVNGARILKSDLDKPRIFKEGGKYTLDELIEEEILVQRAIERHMLPTESDVERHVVAFKMQNGLGDLPQADFEAELKKFGFTLKDYKQQIGSWIASENIKRMEVTDKIVVTSQEVENYYKNNPEEIPAEYYLKMIPAQIDSDKKITLQKEDFVDLGWIKKEDIDPKFEFVLKMEKGQTSQTVNVNNKDYVIELFDKKESRIKTLDERYSQIEKNLTQKKQEKLIKKFRLDLKKNSTIIYL
jgi:foldase protein PrsA